MSCLRAKGLAMSVDALPADVVRLVIAAREVAFGELRDLVNASGDEDQRRMMDELDKASEAFASRVRWDDEPGDEARAFEITTGEPRFDPDGPVKINGIAFVRVGCAKCGGKPIITNLDGDDLCSPCATKWVISEGQAERDAQDAEA